jgi:O-antigen ligase
MLKNIFKNNKIPLILIALIPIGLLISSGVSELLSILLVIFYISFLIYKKDYSIINNLYFKLLLTLWLYLILNSILFSQVYVTSEYSLRSIGFIKYILLIFSFKFYLKKNKNFEFILLFWIFIIVIVAFDIFFESYNGKNILGFVSSHETRIASFLKEELKIGHFMLGFSFLTTGYLFYKSQNRSILFLLLSYLFIIILIISLYLTGERSNAIRGLFCLTLFFIFGNKKILKYKYFFFILTIFSLIILYNLSERIQIRFNGQIVNPIKNNGIVKTLKDSQYGAHYDTAIQIFKSYPLLGVGNKNFRNECQKTEYFNAKLSLTNERCATHPHQIYLELLSEHGLLGTLIILFIIFFILYRNVKIYKKNKNPIHLASILFVLQTFLPLIPSGSFFVSWTATVFWINFSIMMIFCDIKNLKK